MARFSYRSVVWGPPREEPAPPETPRPRTFVTAAYAGTRARRLPGMHRWAPARDVRPGILPARLVAVARPIKHRLSPGVFWRGGRPEPPPEPSERLYPWYVRSERQRRIIRHLGRAFTWRPSRSDEIVVVLPNTPLSRRVFVADRQRVIYVVDDMSRREMVERWQDPNAVLDHMIDWTGYLQSGETIQASGWQVDDPPDGTLVLAAEQNSTTAAVVWASFGTLGNVYKVRNRITTSHGRTDDQTILLYITQM